MVSKINQLLTSFGKTVFALLLILWLTPSNLFAQDPPAKEEPTEEAAEAEEPEEADEPEKFSSKMSLSTTQFLGDTVELQGLLRAKMDKSWAAVPNEKVGFFAIGDEDEKALGEVVTNAKGIAKFRISTKAMALNADGYLAFAARFAGNDELEESDGDANILRASMKLTPVKEDSTITISLNVTAPSPEGETPIAEADVVVYVKRMVGRLKVGEGTTDEEGNVDIDFPTDLAGDDLGNLYITAVIEDYEEYGNIAATTIQAWGRPISYEISELPKSLWSPHPPSWMVITFFVLMAAVWGHYAIVLYKLSQLKKAS